MLVLEEASAAKARGAPILGELAGYGSTSDAYHLTAPEPTGGPAARAITLALDDAGADARMSRYINAHGTSTQLNDAAETAAIKLALGEDAGPTDPDLLDQVGDRPPARRRRRGRGGGHLQALRTGDPAHARLRGARPELRPRLCPRRGAGADRWRRRPAALAISNSFAFGGHNVSLVIKGRGDGWPDLAGKRLLITGVITKDSIAFHVAERAQAEGAEVLLTSFGRVRRMTERAAQRLPEPVDVLELDVNQPEDLRRWSLPS